MGNGGNSKFKIAAVDGDTVELGVTSQGSEVYDAESGQLHHTTRVSVDDLEKALAEAKKAGKAKAKKAEEDAKGFTPRFDPDDPRADSSPRSQDRPPIYISSESNPSEANPQPDVPPSEPIERLGDGLADVPGNRNFDDAPGPNRNEEPTEGVEAPKPKENVAHEDTALGQKEARDAKAAQGTAPASSQNLDDAAARAIKRAAEATAPRPKAVPTKRSHASKSSSRKSASKAATAKAGTETKA